MDRHRYHKYSTSGICCVQLKICRVAAVSFPSLHPQFDGWKLVYKKSVTSSFWKVFKHIQHALVELCKGGTTNSIHFNIAVTLCEYYSIVLCILWYLIIITCQHRGFLRELCCNTVGLLIFEDKKFWGFRGQSLNLENKYPRNFLL